MFTTIKTKALASKKSKVVSAAMVLVLVFAATAAAYIVVGMLSGSGHGDTHPGAATAEPVTLTISIPDGILPGSSTDSFSRVPITVSAHNPNAGSGTIGHVSLGPDAVEVLDNPACQTSEIDGPGHGNQLLYVSNGAGKTSRDGGGVSDPSAAWNIFFQTPVTVPADGDADLTDAINQAISGTLKLAWTSDPDHDQSPCLAAGTVFRVSMAVSGS